MEEEKRKQEVKILNSFPFRLGTYKCAGKDIEEEEIIDLEEQGWGENGETDDKMKKKNQGGGMENKEKTNHGEKRAKKVQKQ